MKKQYIRQVRKDLHIPRSAKTEVVRDLQEIFASAAEHGESEQQVAERLGTPREFADRTAEQFGFDPAARRRRNRLIQIAISLAVAAAAFALYAAAAAQRQKQCGGEHGSGKAFQHYFTSEIFSKPFPNTFFASVTMKKARSSTMRISFLSSAIWVRLMTHIMTCFCWWE